MQGTISKAVLVQTGCLYIGVHYASIVFRVEKKLRQKQSERDDGYLSGAFGSSHQNRERPYYLAALGKILISKSLESLKCLESMYQRVSKVSKSLENIKKSPKISESLRKFQLMVMHLKPLDLSCIFKKKLFFFRKSR